MTTWMSPAERAEHAAERRSFRIKRARWQSVECALAAWNEGLRLEEIAAVTGMSEDETYATLRAHAHVVEDRGACGFFFRNRSGTWQAYASACPTCGAARGKPCTATGLVGLKGSTMVGTVHAKRKRSKPSETF